jgi:hypothetical protein
MYKYIFLFLISYTVLLSSHSPYKNYAKIGCQRMEEDGFNRYLLGSLRWKYHFVNESDQYNNTYS